MYFKTEEIQTPQLYQLLVNGVVPRPLAWVSTIDANGTSNIAPYSFFSVASVNPPVLSITAVPSRDKLAKDTLQNIIDTNQAVVHIVTEDVAEQMNASCADYPKGTSEIDELKLKTSQSQAVAPPSLAETKIRYECTLRQIIEVETSPGGGVLILLDVMGIFVDDAISQDGLIDATKINILGKLGGDDYSDSQVKRTLARPTLKP